MRSDWRSRRMKQLKSARRKRNARELKTSSARKPEKDKINLYSRHTRRHQAINSEAQSAEKSEEEKINKGKDNKRHLRQHERRREEALREDFDLIKKWNAIVGKPYDQPKGISGLSGDLRMNYFSVSHLRLPSNTAMGWTTPLRPQR